MKEKDLGGEGIFPQFTDLGRWIEELEGTITQIQSIDESIQEVRAIAAGFANGLQHGMALIQNGTLLWANWAAFEMLGYQFDEMIDSSVIALAPPDYREKMAARLNNIQAGDVLDTYDTWPLVTKNRVVKQVKAYADRIAYNGKPAILAILVDVTGEQALQEEVSLRAQMLDSVSDAVFLHDMDGNIKYVNKAACDSLGYTRDELTNMNVIDINPEELKRKAQIRLKTISSEKGGRFKTVQVRKNGSRMQVDVHSKVIKMGDKEFVLGVVREITPDVLPDI